MRRFLLAAGMAALLVPATAGATVTASSVDTSAGPFYDEADGHLIITGHVTSDATASDKVKVVYPGAADAKGPSDAGFSIASDGSVSADVGSAFDYWYCPARIVPLVDPGPTYSAAFAPSLIGVDQRDDYPVTTAGSDWYDWSQSAAGPGGYGDGYSLGHCPIDSTYTRTPDNGYFDLLGCSGVSNPADGSKSAIALDGVPALTPYHVYLSLPNPPVIPPVIQNIRHAVNAQTGDVTATDTQALSLCPTSCSAPTDAGAHVDHSWHANHGVGLV